MKKIKFTCTNCDAKLRVPTHLAGVSAPCPKCGATITAPSDITEAVDDDEPRRGAASLSSNGNIARGQGQEASPSHSQSATAVAEPPQQAASPLNATPAPIPVAAQMPLPVPVLPKTTTSVEVPTPISRPLQPRPITPPVAAEAAPAFFTPPPPVLPLTPVAPESDLRTDAPVSIPSAAPVVVEVTTFAVPAPSPPPPAAVITQPIQVNSRPSDLPGVRSEVAGPGSLPRLDVSLAGQDLSAAAAVLFGEHSGQPVRTRVQLPQPGVETHKFSPDDFIVPAANQQDAPPVLEQPVMEAPPALEPFDLTEAPRYLNIPLPTETASIPLDDLDDVSYGELPEFNEAGDFAALPGTGEQEESYFTDLADADEIPAGLEAPAWSEEELAGEFVAPAPVEVPWNLQPSSVPEGIEFNEMEEPHPLETASQGKGFNAEDQYDEIPVNPLHEGSFGKLFSQQAGDSLENIASVPAPAVSYQNVPHTATEPRTIGALPSSIAEQLAQPEGDVLEELFGGSLRNPGESKGLSKTAVVMISCLVGAAAIAVLMVVFLWQVLGGLNPGEAYKEGSLEETSQVASNAKAKGTLPVNEPAITDAPAIIDPVAVARENGDAAPAAGTGESPAVSIDERVQQIVNGTAPAPAGGKGGSVIGSPGLDLVDDAIDKFNTPIQVESPAAALPVTPAPAVGEAPVAVAPSIASAATEAPAMVGPAGQDTPDPASRALTGASAKSANYNPPATFAAPGPNDSPILRTNDVIDAFLRAPDWKTRVAYTYHGDSLQPTIEDYYKKWPDNKIDRYSLQLFQMEQSPELGGPYWVYLVSTSDADQGFPLIIRVEEGNLKVDWEIYSEFYDRHFVRFREGTMPRPATFRVVIERVSDYYGSDREAFTNVKDYYVYQINPPYGDLNEFSEYAFVKKDSDLAKKLDGVVALGDEPLAVIVTLDEKAFEHGVKHFVITEYLTEGWFR